MKKMILSAAMLLLASQAFCGVTLRYENRDSKKVTMKSKMDGNERDVTFDNATSSVTIQGSGTKCVIETSCGKVEVKDGDHIIIKDGCIKMNN
jgi:hypothetical protein